MAIFPPRRIATWLQDIATGVTYICSDALEAIRHEDPNMWWRTTPRGDWMLYALSLLMHSRGEGRMAFSMGEISRHVGCPKAPSGGWIWNSIHPLRFVTETDLAALAVRVRALYPDLPLSA